ncbi:hypothetical protein NA57DRAFT_77949 [Rhizodiscina lignyota]|uniref:CASTOR ACT domain-containing protein n=1 Tax=Rhizodiscina lignyota TaxID=1504668 RepID=A0A9P4I980_9PEZI|nr:hypothetical protein NA57DRAFT_77949 [Rhizodiscina lignyota]
MLNLRDPRLHIAALEARLHLYQLPPDIVLPEELQLPRQKDAFYSITYTSNEISIITQTLAVSDSVKELQKQGTLKYEGPWSCLKINGPMDLTLTGVMAAMTTPLARGSIAVFAISTWNTDFILLHDVDRSRAIDALRATGWTVDDLG